MVGEVARGLSLFGGASSEVRRCNCSVVDESRSSLAGLGARCVFFYQKSISIYLSPDYREQFWSSTQAHGQIESDLWRLELGPNDERIRKNVDPQNAILSEETFKLSTPKHAPLSRWCF